MAKLKKEAITKAQRKLRDMYHAQLKRCGFRSWKKANDRRVELIKKKVYFAISPVEGEILADLQKLCGLYQRYKTNDSMKHEIRRLARMLKKLN